MSGHKQRNTLYALISALELDLRDIVEATLVPSVSLESLLSEETRERCRLRWTKAQDVPAAREPTAGELLQFTDLGDVLQCINKHEALLPQAIMAGVKKWRDRLNKIVQVRNRVMHTRPLEFDDYDIVTDTARQLTLSLTSSWSHLRDTIKDLRNPAFAARIQIPDVEESIEEVLNNLPAPDFDDTGFYGRSDEQAKLKQALLGPFPVVTLVGEGGVGKSALALKVAYELADAPNSFDAIVWTTAKANRLTQSEIVAIDDAINTSLGVMEAASNYLGRNADGGPVEDLLQNLKNNRILLIIDNLETILDEAIRDFVSRVSGNSKILFTTRVGLGAFDFPIRLDPFPAREAAHFLRRTCLVWGVNDIAKAPPKLIDDYCRQLQFNPLFIKWFVQAVQSGQSPQAVLANPKILLQFCLENVFDHLDSDARTAAFALLTTGGALTQPALLFVTELSHDRLQVALSSLISSSIAFPQRATEVGGEDTYALTQLARYYLGSYRAPKPDLQKRFLDRQNALRAYGESQKGDQARYNYDPLSVQARTADDFLVVRILRDAMHALAIRHDYSEATRLVEKAYAVSPNFFEVRRVSAQLCVWENNYVKAEAEFEAAKSLNPNSPAVRYHFGVFLTRQKKDFARAIEEFDGACKLDALGAAPRIELARVLMFEKQFKLARTHLDQIGDFVGVPFRLRRKYIDLCIQVECREADFSVGMGQEGLALDLVASARAKYEAAQRQGEADKHTAEHAIRLLGGVLPRLRRELAGTPRATEVVSHQNWLAALARDNLPVRTERWMDRGGDGRSTPPELQHSAPERQTGRIASLVELFGFIDAVDGHRYFFHRNHMEDREEYSSLEIGTLVEFSQGYNDKGVCAVRVKVLDS
jgi:tetratricopeptide (TPR) repeat protein/cold shock CspA family protein